LLFKTIRGLTGIYSFRGVVPIYITPKCLYCCTLICWLNHLHMTFRTWMWEMIYG